MVEEGIHLETKSQHQLQPSKQLRQSLLGEDFELQGC